jgi:hypothetical protein
MHWIQFPNLTEHGRAIGALLDVYREYQVLPDSQFVVTDEHIKALQKAKVRFKYLFTDSSQWPTLAVNFLGAKYKR